MRRWLPHIGIAFGICLVAYGLLFRASEEDRILALFNKLEEAVVVHEGNHNIVVRGAKIRSEFSEIFSKQVSVAIPELRRSSAGRTDLAKMAAAAPQAYQTASIDLDGLQIDLDAQKVSAIASGKAVLIGNRHGHGMQRDVRTLSLRLDKIDGEWQIVSVSVSAKNSADRARREP